MKRRFLNNIKSISGDYHSKYFTIEALEDGLTAKLSTNVCEYRIDNGSWIALSAATNTPSINKGQTLSFKGNLTPNSSSGIGTFTISNKCNVSGNIMSLLYGDNFEEQYDLTGKNYAFYSLFSGCSIVNSNELILPALRLSSYCYKNMFKDCEQLVTCPELPSSNLASYCYHDMFKSCYKLTEIPYLPAKKLVAYCYYGMFNNCKGLINADKLTFETVTIGSCKQMFENCINLKIPPKILPPTVLYSECYWNMFGNCTSLTIAPVLPATTLAQDCYRGMFWKCVSLTESPILSSTTLQPYCYYSMFESCSSLNKITMLATDISASNCLTSWVYGVASTGTFVKNAAMTSLPTGTSGIPSGWTVEDNFYPVECRSLSITADNVSGRATTTKIYYTAELYGYDNNNNYITITKTGETVSEEFPQNTSETETVTRTISYTYMGVTATTTIIQGVWINQSYTVDLNNQWELSSTISNPDSSLFDGVYQSFSNKGINSKAAVMYIDIVGYTDFDLYIRSYAESNYDYVMVSQLDQTIDNNTSYSNSTLVKAHTRGSQISDTDISHYTHVQFTGIDGGEHRITIVYRKDSSGNKYDDRGYVLILKNKNTSNEGNLITFTIEGIEYQAEEGMTWADWVNSEYNMDGYFIDYDKYIRKLYGNRYWTVETDNGVCIKTDFILNTNYLITDEALGEDFG